MSDLRSQLQRITEEFVSSVMSAMRSASLFELAEQGGTAGPAAALISGAVRRSGAAQKAPAGAAKPGGGQRRKRASPQEVKRQKDTALAVAKALKPGFSKGEVMRKSGSKVDLGRALSLLVADGKLSKKGDRRLARYWVK
jgi:phage-related minor tail protein